VGDRGVQVDAVTLGERQEFVAVFEPELALEDEQEPLPPMAVGGALGAVSRNVEDHRMHRPVAPLIGPVLDRGAIAPILAERLDAALALFHGHEARGRRQPGHERVDTALERHRKFHEAIERRRELAVLQLGEPAHGEVGPRHHLFERHPPSEASGADALAEVGEIDGGGHGWPCRRCRHTMRLARPPRKRGRFPLTARRFPAS